MFAHVGGEEFVILLNNTSLVGAKNLAEKIRENVERNTFNYDGISIKITISIGISELNRDNNSIEEIYKQADKKLYQAKETGRNKIAS